MNTNILLSTAYLPPVEYFSLLMDREVWIESRENYCKQSYRNRARILTGNGIQALSVPVIHDTHKPLITNARIEYTTPWQRNHWRAIETAYNASPYYLYYKDALQPFFERRFDTLFEFNMLLLETLLKLLRIHTSLKLTTDFEMNPDPDLRTLIHPKRSTLPDYPFKTEQSYYQVFEDRFGFTPNLSVIDLLFNTGPEAGHYISNLQQQLNARLPEDGKR